MVTRGEAGNGTNEMTQCVPKTCSKLGPSLRDNILWETMEADNMIRDQLNRLLGGEQVGRVIGWTALEKRLIKVAMVVMASAGGKAVIKFTPMCEQFCSGTSRGQSTPVPG